MGQPCLSDPVFRASQSSLFRADLQPKLSDFYDTRAESGELGGAFNRPLPFRLQQPGDVGEELEGSYPVYVDSGLTGARVSGDNYLVSGGNYALNTLEAKL
eukprot:5820708-Pyramimonas_sp.AAC.1